MCRIFSSVWTCWLIFLMGFAVLGSGPTSAFGAETPALKEYELKAAFLYNFTKFVEWPSRSFPDANAPFVVVVAGNSPCAVELEKIAKERKINGRHMLVKRATTFEAAHDAQALFISASEDSRAKDWLSAVRGRSVLTIGESDSFCRQGGIINFVLEGQKIRFEINMEQAETAGLKVSAQLQKLARTVLRK